VDGNRTWKDLIIYWMEYLIRTQSNMFLNFGNCVFFLIYTVPLNQKNNLDQNAKYIQLVAKKTGTVRIKLTHFCNFSIVCLTRDRLELTSKFNDIFYSYLIGIVK
jgi:hypothetical protein